MCFRQFCQFMHRYICTTLWAELFVHLRTYREMRSPTLAEKQWQDSWTPLCHHSGSGVTISAVEKCFSGNSKKNKSALPSVPAADLSQVLVQRSDSCEQLTLQEHFHVYAHALPWFLPLEHKTQIIFRCQTSICVHLVCCVPHWKWYGCTDNGFFHSVVVQLQFIVPFPLCWITC